MSAATDITGRVLATAEQQLREQGKKPTPEEVEQQGRWLFALFYSAALRESCDAKDMADLFMSGIPPIGTVLAECEALLAENPLEDRSTEFLDWLEHGDQF